MNITEFYNKYKNTYITKNGGTSNYVQDGEPFGGQCVSLVQAFMYKVCGIPVKARGHAKDFGQNLVANKLAKEISFNSIKNGDIIVFQDLGLYKGVYYGHIGIYYNGKVFDQNPHKAKLSNIYGGRKKVYRLNKYADANKQKAVPLPAGYKSFGKTRTYQCKTNIVVQSWHGLNTNPQMYKPYFKKGETFKSGGYVDYKDIRWLRVTWKNGTIVGYVPETYLKYIKEGRKKYEEHYYLKDITK